MFTAVGRNQSAARKAIGQPRFARKNRSNHAPTSQRFIGFVMAVDGAATDRGEAKVALMANSRSGDTSRHLRKCRS